MNEKRIACYIYYMTLGAIFMYLEFINNIHCLIIIISEILFCLFVMSDLIFINLIWFLLRVIVCVSNFVTTNHFG